MELPCWKAGLVNPNDILTSVGSICADAYAPAGVMPVDVAGGVLADGVQAINHNVKAMNGITQRYLFISPATRRRAWTGGDPASRRRCRVPRPAPTAPRSLRRSFPLQPVHGNHLYLRRRHSGREKTQGGDPRRR